MRLRQVALVARELEPVVGDLCAVLGIEVGFRDPGVGTFGLVNAVMPVGDTFLEVVSPERLGTTAGRLLDRRGGDGGYMVIAHTDDLDVARKRMAELEVRIAWETTLDDAATLHLHPRDVGGAIVSLDWMDPPESWRWGGPDWRAHVRTDVVSAIGGVELAAEDPRVMAERWAAVLDRRLATDEGGTHALQLDAGLIRFRRAADGEPEGVCGLLFETSDPGRIAASGRARGLEVDGDAVRVGGVWLRPA